MASLIGMVMLMGIVTKNSILLIEYAIMARRDFGLSRTEAIIDACHKPARPIIMTMGHEGQAAGLPRVYPLESERRFVGD